jgi:hypothetical protein
LANAIEGGLGYKQGRIEWVRGTIGRNYIFDLGHAVDRFAETVGGLIGQQGSGRQSPAGEGQGLKKSSAGNWGRDHRARSPYGVNGRGRQVHSGPADANVIHEWVYGEFQRGLQTLGHAGVSASV